MHATLTIARLSAGYPRRPVIRDLSLPPLPAAAVTALVGPNAAGKSTLLKALAGLVQAEGRVQFGDAELLRMPLAARADLIGFMPQALPQGVALSVLESIVAAFEASRPDELAGADAARRAVATLDRLGIADLALDSLDQLSGGQRQLVSLAQALVREPRLLLLDEPTSALDLRHQVTVMEAARSLAAEGRTVLVVLHDLNLAARWAERVVVLDHGRVAAIGTPAEALTARTLAAVWGVAARIEQDPAGIPHVVVEGALPPAPGGPAAHPFDPRPTAA
ncbi:ABC transporter ATP-binding protein [Rhodoplanes sp. TEM]|uniref:ABC transporter ATP-binding protein n=1 Tax=Rhodoplanes tepidamans TaxID=200616 RepID=A0ABT5J8A3_RHOTP|nr:MULTISPECIES: ABC transporter ATP-binding protein [Rhodoplanes]MDC7785733.1 ABC transporter ATP-binding protein [Rhodoplanes tepidamans]MDC7986301.1 ABC transporter ATP-binding protein [Rhodoplanes sp. TEM]MDQ0354705.1 iron complex transport system ATP-binding protein [Rhodoplanes tepidamans]